jgi:MFS family permease
MLTGSDAPMSGGTVDRARIVLLAAGHAVDDSYQGAVPALLPFFVFARHYSYLEATGLTFALTSFSSVIQPLFGALADRYGRVPVTAASLAGALAGLAALVLTPLPWVFLPVAVTGFALFQSFSLTVTLGQDYLPSRIGASSGVTLGLAISVGGLLAPAFGAIADATSLHLALITLLAFPPAALALALRLRDPARQPGTARRPGSRIPPPRQHGERDGRPREPGPRSRACRTGRIAGRAPLPTRGLNPAPAG